MADSILAVCAHPDDESFGLGALLASWAEEGAAISVLSFTHGEASSLGSDLGDLHAMRGFELTAAARELGIGTVRLLGHPDGRLSGVPIDELRSDVEQAIRSVGANLLLVFDDTGVTGHPDHVRATEAALATAETEGLPVLAWTLPASVASQLNDEFAVEFRGRLPAEIDLLVEVDRGRQERAILCHTSQATENPVLRRRLELLGTVEALRWLLR